MFHNGSGDNGVIFWFGLKKFSHNAHATYIPLSSRHQDAWDSKNLDSNLQLPNCNWFIIMLCLNGNGNNYYVLSYNSIPRVQVFYGRIMRHIQIELKISLQTQVPHFSLECQAQADLICEHYAMYVKELVVHHWSGWHCGHQAKLLGMACISDMGVSDATSNRLNKTKAWLCLKITSTKCLKRKCLFIIQAALEYLTLTRLLIKSQKLNLCLDRIVILVVHSYSDSIHYFQKTFGDNITQVSYSFVNMVKWEFITLIHKQ